LCVEVYDVQMRTFADLWKLYSEHALPGRTWHWWWWLFFFENPERPDYPQQLMILWGTRNCRKVRINDFQWNPRIIPEVTDGRARFESVVASWYCDGAKMHDPFIIENGPTETKWTDDYGSILMESTRGRYWFGGRDSDFKLTVENPEVGLDLRMEPWTDYMRKLVLTGRHLVGKQMGYSLLKYRGMLASGTMRHNGKEFNVNGRAYFQKVWISSITPCWYWAAAQWDSGAYMQYFLPHVGVPMLRQAYSHKSAMDWGKKMVSPTLNFFDPFENKQYIMKDVRVRKRYENDLPIFTVHARADDSELMAEMATYGRCCWNITQPFIWPFWLGIFYNEYPARMIDFRFRSGGRKLEMKDLGRCFCNCEHTWGTV
jgi:hypothetical protein